jgi:hypothetical protein
MEERMSRREETILKIVSWVAIPLAWAALFFVFKWGIQAALAW